MTLPHFTAEPLPCTKACVMALPIDIERRAELL